MNRQYCPHCARKVREEGKCPYCGFDMSAYTADNRSLPPDSRVENYLIGTLLAANRQAQFYAAVDMNDGRRVIAEEFLPFVTMGRAAESEEARVVKHPENVEKAKELFQESWQERCIPLLQAVRCNGTVYRIYDAGEGELEELAEKLADDPVLFRENGSPVMSVTATPIPPMPEKRNYRGTGAEKKKGSGAGRFFALLLGALALVAGTWAGTKVLNHLDLLPFISPEVTPEVVIVTVTTEPTATPAPTEIPPIREALAPGEAQEITDAEIQASLESADSTPVPALTEIPELTVFPEPVETMKPTEVPAPEETGIILPVEILEFPDPTSTPVPAEMPTTAPTEPPVPAETPDRAAAEATATVAVETIVPDVTAVPTAEPSPEPTPVAIRGIELKTEGRPVYDGRDWADRITVTLTAADGTELKRGEAFEVQEGCLEGWTDAGEYTLDAGQIILEDGFVFDGNTAGGSISIGRKVLDDPYWEPPFSGTIPFFACDRKKLNESITVNGEDGAYRIRVDGADGSLFTWEWAEELPQEELFTAEIRFALKDSKNYCFRNGGETASLELTVGFCPDPEDSRNWTLMREQICRAIETEGLMGRDRYYDPAKTDYKTQDSELIVYLYRAYLYKGNDNTDAETEIRKWLSEEPTRAEFASYMRYLESRSGKRNDPDAQGMEIVMNLLKDAGQGELLTLMMAGELNAENTEDTEFGKEIQALRDYLDSGEDSGKDAVSGLSRMFVLSRLREYGKETDARAEAILKQIAPEQEKPGTAGEFYRLMQSAAESLRKDLAYLSDEYGFEGKAVLPDGELTEPFREVLAQAAGKLKIRLRNRNLDSLASEGIGTLIGEIHKKAEEGRAAEQEKQQEAGADAPVETAGQPSEEPEPTAAPEEAEVKDE